MAARKKRKRPLVADGPKTSIAGESLSMMSATAGESFGGAWKRRSLTSTTCWRRADNRAIPLLAFLLLLAFLFPFLKFFLLVVVVLLLFRVFIVTSAPPRVVGQIRAPADGKLLKRVVADDETLKAAAEPAVVATVRLCTHSTIVRGCARCGRSVATGRREARQRVTMSGTASNIKVDKTEAVAIHRQFSTRLRTAKKLS